MHTAQPFHYLIFCCKFFSFQPPVNLRGAGIGNSPYFLSILWQAESGDEVDSYKIYYRKNVSPPSDYYALPNIATTRWEYFCDKFSLGVEYIAISAGGLGFDTPAGKIEHSVTNDSPPPPRFFGVVLPRR